MEVITSKKCSACLDVLPMRDYRFISSKMLYAARCRCCEADESRNRARKAGSKPRTNLWTDAELSVLHEVFPLHGATACAAQLPGRTQMAISTRAKYDGLSYLGPKLSGSPSKEDEPWSVPQHDYCDADIAMRRWPALGSVVGIMSPSVGLVMGGGVS